MRRLNDLVAEIDKRKLMEKQLTRTEECLRNVIGNAPVILFALDRSGLLTLSEGKGLDAFGLKPSQLVGQSIFDLYRDSPSLDSNARRALAGETVFVTEVNMSSLKYISFRFSLRKVKSRSSLELPIT
jgi:PAS domain-containing protein